MSLPWDIGLQDKVIRRLEVIGEASKRLSESFKQAILQIPWQQISATRNKIVHDYFDVDIRVMWDTVQNDLPALKKALQDKN